MTTLDTLLGVQDHDTAIDRLRHKRETLPERKQLAEIAGRLATLHAEIDEVIARRDEVGGRQAKFEADMQAGEKRIADIEKRMYSGEVTATRDLMAMTEEVESLRKRCSHLEDQALETLDERDQLDRQLASFADQRDAILAEQQDVAASLAAAEAAIDAETAVEREQREALSSGLPQELLLEYGRLRERLGGIGAARLVGPTCDGCHLALPATELDRIKKLPADAIIFCDQCGRILIR